MKDENDEEQNAAVLEADGDSDEQVASPLGPGQSQQSSVFSSVQSSLQRCQAISQDR